MQKNARKIALASDHAGFELKEVLKKSLRDYQVIDLGTNSTDSVDYPDFGRKAVAAIADGEADLAVVICGSGIGISIAANRAREVRCALCVTPEMARLARLHNDANMLALAARLVPAEENVAIVRMFLETEFEGGRHQKRVDKLTNSI